MLKIDIFCRVIDNYGDIGVCWRLARQLVAEHGCDVRLIVDDLSAFRVVAPGIDPTATRQYLLGVEVLSWGTDEHLKPREVVIEAFACDPPQTYVELMAQRTPKPFWINLEYLSAEAWVDDVHGMPSQHQRLPLIKYFFCPGFTENSGGLIRESGVSASASVGATCRDPQNPVLHSGRDKSLLQEPAAPHNSLRLFAFAYPHAPMLALTQGFAVAGVATDVTVAAPLSQTDPAWQFAPAVPQPEFDALLAPFDFLIVRGEDSFVRAQWAAKPFLWHIYPTADGAHLVKLDAWLDRYCDGLDASAASAYRAASHAFNTTRSDSAQSAPYALLAQHMAALADHAVLWRDTLLRQSDLATRLLKFVAAHRLL